MSILEGGLEAGVMSFFLSLFLCFFFFFLTVPVVPVLKAHHSHLKGLLSYGFLGLTQRSWFSKSWVRSENLHFSQVPR